MRLATSGPVHNLLTYAGIWFLTFTSAGGMFWRDRGGEGRVVHDIDPVGISAPPWNVWRKLKA